MKIEICNIRKSDISEEDALFLAKLIKPYGYKVCDLKSVTEKSIEEWREQKYRKSLHDKLEYFLENDRHVFELLDYDRDKISEIYYLAELEYEKAEYEDDKVRMKLINNFLSYIDTRFDGIFNEQSLRKKSVF